jgi:hypothetical protein
MASFIAQRRREYEALPPDPCQPMPRPLDLSHLSCMLSELAEQIR